MSYVHQIRRAIDHIENHLTEPVGIDDAARAAGLSRWYFQRIFRACAGDSVHEYLTKRRITEAARELRGSSRSVLEIALKYQFGSNEAFTRAFKRLFLTSPSRYRAGAETPATFPRIRITQAHLQHLYRGISMKPTITRWGGLSYVGVRGSFRSALGPDSDTMEVIPTLWRRFLPRASEVRRASGPTIGIVECEPDAGSAERWASYTAAIQVSGFDAVPVGMTSGTVPAGEFAEFVHRGPTSSISATVNYIYGSWLPSSGYERGHGPEIEIYPPQYAAGHPDAEMRFLIPVRR